MNNNLIKLWIEAVGIDEVLKTPQAMFLIGPAKLWAEGSIEGLEFEKASLENTIAELTAKKVEVEDRITNVIV